MKTISRERVRRFVAPVLLAVSLVAAGLSALPSQAQEIAPEQLALARKYVDLTDRAGVYELTLTQMAVKTFQLFAPQNPNLEEQLKAAITKTIEALKPNKEELMNQFALVYATAFTAEELQQIIAFYESPVGQKLSSSSVANNDAIQKVMGVFTNNLGTEFVSKVRAEMKALGFDI
jgi:hypothetical protein